MDRFVVLEGGGWKSPPVGVAFRSRARRQGLRRGAASALLLWGRSVHAVGMGRSLRLARLAPDGTVDDVRLLLRGRLVLFRRSGWILELPVRWPVPSAGTRLLVRPILPPCPAA